MKTFNAKNPSPFTLQSRLRQRELDREWINRGREGEREVVRERERERDIVRGSENKRD